MATKRFELVFEEIEEGGFICTAKGFGYNALELIGILETKKQDIVKQISDQSSFKRTFINPDGSKIEIEDGDY